MRNLCGSTTHRIIHHQSRGTATQAMMVPPRGSQSTSRHYCHGQHTHRNFHSHLHYNRGQCRHLSSWNQRGYDMTFESLTFGKHGTNAPPKCILQGYGPSGFDVFNVVKKMDDNEVSDGTLHYHGSILAFSNACFLWNVEQHADITVDSLAPIFLHQQPPLEMLFLGVDIVEGPDGTKTDIPVLQLNAIRLACQKHNIVMEKMRVADAMGHFNILNAQDRPVAAALLLDANASSWDD